jgi:hypothetical protein
MVTQSRRTWQVSFGRSEILLKIRVHAAATKQHATIRSHAIWLNPENEQKRILHTPRTQLFLDPRDEDFLHQCGGAYV